MSLKSTERAKIGMIIIVASTECDEPHAPQLAIIYISWIILSEGECASPTQKQRRDLSRDGRNEKKGRDMLGAIGELNSPT